MAVLQLPSAVSFTALQTAAERAAESSRSDALFRDPFAQAMLAVVEGESGRVTAVEGGTLLPRFSPDMQWLFHNYVALRTHYLDQKLLAAASEGLSQVVFLAAGMDGRGYRLAWPAETTIYELDKPDLLSFKQEVARRAKLSPTARLIAVPADLREDWLSPLLSAGFDLDQPTLWLLEGILQYLEVGSADQLFATLSKVSAPGSRLISVYHVGDHLEPARRTGHDKADDIVAYAKIAQVGRLIRPEQWLPRHGWNLETTNLVAWADLLGRPSPPAMDPAQGGADCYLINAHHPD